MPQLKLAALGLLLCGLTACAASTPAMPTLPATLLNASSATPVVAPIRSAPSTLPPTMIVVPTMTVAATIAVAVMPTLPPIVVTNPIGTATPRPTTPAPTLPIKPQPTAAPPTATSTPVECPALPAPTTVETQAAAQRFEHGRLFWLQANNEVWALIDSPLADQFYWRVLPNLWSEGQPEYDPAIQPPAGLFQPIRGFGMAWRSGGGSYGPLRADLGWAQDEEIGFTTTLTYYPQGFYSPDCTWIPKSGIYELEDDHGATFQFVGAGGGAKIVKGD